MIHQISSSANEWLPDDSCASDRTLSTDKPTTSSWGNVIVSSLDNRCAATVAIAGIEIIERFGSLRFVHCDVAIALNAVGQMSLRSDGIGQSC